MKINWSEWATLNKALSKANGLISLWGDFKVAINPELKIDQYPLPRIEDIFNNIELTSISAR